jgi:hypothetical protein
MVHNARMINTRRLHYSIDVFVITKKMFPHRHDENVLAPNVKKPKDQK